MITKVYFEVSICWKDGSNGTYIIKIPKSSATLIKAFRINKCVKAIANELNKKEHHVTNIRPLKHYYGKCYYEL